MDATSSTSTFRTGLRFTLVQPGSHFQVQHSEASRPVVASNDSPKHDPSLPPNKLTRTYACAECGLSTTRSRMFLLHQLVSHAKQHNFHLFLCPHCEYGSRWRQKLVRHSEILHGTHPTAAPLTPQRVREQFESFGRDLDLLLAWTHSSSNSSSNSNSNSDSNAGAGANLNLSNPTPTPARPARPARPLGGAMPSQVPLPSLLLVPSASEQSQAYATPLDLSIKRSPSASASADADSPQTQTPPSDAPANESPRPPILARSNKRKNKAPQRVAEPSAASPEPELCLSSCVPLAEQSQDADSDELLPLHVAEAEGDEELLEGDSLDNADVDADADAEQFSLTLPHAKAGVGFASASTLELSAGPSSARLRCGQCGYLAPHPSKLRSHLAAHANLRAYMCSICGVRSNWPSDIRFGLRVDFVSSPL